MHISQFDMQKMVAIFKLSNCPQNFIIPKTNFEFDGCYERSKLILKSEIQIKSHSNIYFRGSLICDGKIYSIH